MLRQTGSAACDRHVAGATLWLGMARLQRAWLLQDALTEELVGLAAGLKQNAAAMQKAVTDRGRLLEDADTALHDNLANVKRSAQESKVMVRRCALILQYRSQATLCLFCLLACQWRSASQDGTA